MRKGLFVFLLGTGIGFCWLYYGSEFRLGAITELFGIVATVLLIEDYLRKREESIVYDRKLPSYRKAIDDINRELMAIHFSLMHIKTKVREHTISESVTVSATSKWTSSVRESLDKIQSYILFYVDYIPPEVHTELVDFKEKMGRYYEDIFLNLSGKEIIEIIDMLMTNTINFSEYISEKSGARKQIFWKSASDIVEENKNR